MYIKFIYLIIRMVMVFFSRIFTCIQRFSTKYEGNEGMKLYRYLLRQCQKLPKGPKEHYRFMVKQSFKQHVKESDPERVKEIIKRSYEDSEWILKKYLGK